MSPALCSASHRSPAGLLTVGLEEGGGRPCWGRWQVVSGHHPSAPPLTLMECLWGLSWDTEIPLPTSSERPGGNGLANRPVVTCMDHAHLPIHLFSLNPESSQSVWQGAQTGGCRSCPEALVRYCELAAYSSPEPGDGARDRVSGSALQAATQSACRPSVAPREEALPRWSGSFPAEGSATPRPPPQHLRNAWAGRRAGCWFSFIPHILSERRPRAGHYSRCWEHGGAADLVPATVTPATAFSWPFILASFPPAI